MSGEEGFDLERLASRWLCAATLVLLASQAHAQQGDSLTPAPPPAEASPEPSESPPSTGANPEETVDASSAAPPAAAPTPAGATPEGPSSTSLGEPAPAAPTPAGATPEGPSSTSLGEPAPAAPAQAPSPATTPAPALAPAATRTPNRFGATAAARAEAAPAQSPRADYADYAAEAEEEDGYRRDAYQQNAEDPMDDPMDSGLTLRAGVEIQGARRFGSLTRDVLGSDAIRDGITQQTGVTIDPNEYIQTMEDFMLPASTDFQLAAGLNLGGLIFYRLEGIATFGTLTSLGAYNGLGLCLHFGPVYLSIGIGGRVSWLMHPELEGGVSLAGRVPLDLTAYLAPDFALFLQGGMGWGVDIVKVKNVDDIATANTATFDISGGIRFP